MAISSLNKKDTNLTAIQKTKKFTSEKIVNPVRKVKSLIWLVWFVVGVATWLELFGKGPTLGYAMIVFISIWMAFFLEITKLITKNKDTYGRRKNDPR